MYENGIHVQVLVQLHTICISKKKNKQTRRERNRGCCPLRSARVPLTAVEGDVLEMEAMAADLSPPLLYLQSRVSLVLFSGDAVEDPEDCL